MASIHENSSEHRAAFGVRVMSVSIISSGPIMV